AGADRRGGGMRCVLARGAEGAACAETTNEPGAGVHSHHFTPWRRAEVRADRTALPQSPFTPGNHFTNVRGTGLGRTRARVNRRQTGSGDSATRPASPEYEPPSARM